MIRKIKSLTESYSKNEIKNWLKASIDTMQADEEITICRYYMDDSFELCVYWGDGFDPNDSDVIHSKETPTYALVCGLKCRNDSEWDGAYLNSPFDPESNDLYTEDYTIEPNGNLDMLADWLIEDYEDMKLHVSNNDKIGGLSESKEQLYYAVDTQDPENSDNTRKYTKDDLYDFAKELIAIEKDSADKKSVKARTAKGGQLTTNLDDIKRVLRSFNYEVKGITEEKVEKTEDSKRRHLRATDMITEGDSEQSSNFVHKGRDGLHWINPKTGEEFALLEGEAYKANATSDIIFVMRIKDDMYDTDWTPKWLFGASVISEEELDDYLLDLLN